MSIPLQPGETGHDGSGVSSWRRSHTIRIADESSLLLSIRLSKAPWARDLVLIKHSLLLEISLYTFSICLSCSRFRCQSDGTVLSSKIFSNWSQYDVVGVESSEKFEWFSHLSWQYIGSSNQNASVFHFIECYDWVPSTCLLQQLETTSQINLFVVEITHKLMMLLSIARIVSCRCFSPRSTRGGLHSTHCETIHIHPHRQGFKHEITWPLHNFVDHNNDIILAASTIPGLESSRVVPMMRVAVAFEVIRDWKIRQHSLSDASSQRFDKVDV